jgi:hypothetical protein
MASGFTYDLGVFDPTFPGITLYFPTQATWDKLSAHTGLVFTAVKADMLGKNPHRSSENVTRDEILRHLSTGLNFSSPLSQDEREHLGRSLIERASDDAVSFLAVSSCHVHERRHFHDWLLSPYAAGINAIRIEVFLNYAQLRPVLRAGGTTVIPVPLPRWIRKSNQEKVELIQMWQSLLGDDVEVRVPELKDPELLSVIETIERRYRSIGILFEPMYGTKLDAASVFEASALLMQTQDIHDMLGPTAHQLFLSYMVEGGQENRYTWFVRAMNNLRRPDEKLENDTLSSIATWCLLGSSNADLANSNPLTRMFNAVKYVKENGFPEVSTSTDALFGMLDQASGAMPYVTVLNRSLQDGEGVLEFIQETIAGDRSNFGRGLLQTYYVLEQLHRYMVGEFLNDPDGYCRPTGYLDRNLEKWPEPPVRYAFGQPFFRVNRANLPKYERATLFESASTGDDAFLRQFIQPFPEGLMPGHQSLDIGIADNWQFLCGQADVVFAEYNREKPEFDYHREQARRNGLYFLEVLN